jgi:hypothetical protein
VISDNSGKGTAVEDAEDLGKSLSEDADSNNNSNNKLLIMNDSGKCATTGAQIEVFEEEVGWSMEAQAAKDSDSDLEIVEERREDFRVC